MEVSSNMKRVDIEVAREVTGGGTHYHWICFDKRIYISAPYKSPVTAGEKVDAHRKKYKKHKKKVFVFSCDRNCGK